MQTQELIVTREDSGERLDVFLARRLPGRSRSQWQRLVRAGCVEIGSRPARKAGEEITAGERIRVRWVEKQAHAEPEALPLEIVYEDADLVVVNKPAGMVVHRGAGVTAGTLVNALLHHVRELSSVGGQERPGIVHRLDKMTSGLMLVAKNDFSHRKLAAAFKSRAIHKKYVALVHGRVEREAGAIVATVSRDPVRRVRMKAGAPGGRDAETRYRVLRRHPHFTLLEALPRTGRTHQIRVHLAFLGHPVVGDALYGAPRRIRRRGGEEGTIPRTFLHASKLEFAHPRTGKLLSFEAPLPEELRRFLESL